MIAVTVLGSSGVYPTTERAASGYLAELDGRLIWIDAGPGTWRNLVRHADYKKLEGVFLTHRHPDHTVDVFMAYHARFFGQDPPCDPIPLWAPGETLDALLGFYDDSREGFQPNAITASSTVEIGESQLSFSKMAHPPDTLGVRIENNGAVLAYSADTGPAADFEALAGNADVFICEATAQDADESWGGHLSASEAGSIAARVGVKKLVLTHLPPERDHQLSLAEAKATAGSVEVELAYDGLRMEVGK